jgi:hypothetical protein
VGGGRERASVTGTPRSSSKIEYTYTEHENISRESNLVFEEE